MVTRGARSAVPLARWRACQNRASTGPIFDHGRVEQPVVQLGARRTA